MNAASEIYKTVVEYESKQFKFTAIKKFVSVNDNEYQYLH